MLTLALLAVPARATPRAAGGETPVDIATLGNGAPGSSASATQVHGFGVLDYTADAATGRNSVNISALALSLFRSNDDHRLVFFGQLTAHPPEIEPFLGAEAPGEDVETEIDNLLVTWSLSPRAGLDLTAGKFDSPLGVERDDAPLNYQATPSFLLDFGRPVKFTGAMLHDAFSPRFELTGIVADGEDVTPDNNRAKTGALYAEFNPSLGAHMGLGGIAGNQEDGLLRTTMVATLLLQPSPGWVAGGEGVAGAQDRPAGAGGRDRWSGALLFVHHRFAGRWAGTVRAGVLDDPDGLRTGAAQTLASVTVSPQYLLGGGAYGIFHYLDGTTLPLAQVAVRLDLRWDRSGREVFAGRHGAPSRDRYTGDLQVVYVF